MKYLLITFILLPYTSFSQFIPIQTSPLGNDGIDSKGVSWIDYDNDGYEDIFITTSPSPENSSGKDLLYRNNGDGTFTKITSGILVSTDGTGRNSTWADYDNDGLIDVFVVNQLETSLYRNEGNGVFSKILTVPRLSFSFDTDHSGGAWGDYDGDGFVDLFLSSSKLSEDALNFVFRNNGDGTFQHLPDNILATKGNCQDPSWIDYDQNGTLDLFVPSYFGKNYLFLNQGGGVFTSITSQAITTLQETSLGASWADYDNDGDFDVLIQGNVNNGNLFFENNGDGTFSQKINELATILSSSASWSDFDNDGFIDIIVTGGAKTYLFHNNGDKTFTDVSMEQGITVDNYSWAVASADYNQDGFIDFFIANVHGNGLSPDDILYQNTPNNNNWISIKLSGTNSNRSAIGTTVRISTSSKRQWRTVQSKTGHGGQNSLSAHFGLGAAEKIDTILIEWPGRGFQELLNHEVNQFIQLTEIDFPDPPTELSATNHKYKQVKLTWNDNFSEAQGFRIERSKGNTKNFKPIQSTSAGELTYTDVGLDEDVTYYYRVASTTAGGFSLYSNVSSVYIRKHQTVVFEPIGSKALGTPPFELHATSSSGLQPSFVVVDGLDNVSLNGSTLSILALGNSTIGAFQAGSDIYFASDTATQILEVTTITKFEEFTSGQWVIYPNPVKDALHVHLPTGIPSAQMHIQSMTGQSIQSLALTAPHNVISMKEVHSGFYILSIGQNRIKIIKTD